MNRRDALIGLGALCAAHSRTAAALRADGMLTAADVHVDGYPTVQAVRWMSERIAAQTGGRLRIRVYHAGQLGRESDTVDLTRFGALDLTRVNFASLNNAFPATRVFALPYVFESVEHMRRAADGKPGAAVLEEFARRELVGLAIYDAGSRSFYNVRRAVHEPHDLHGLKVRVPPSDIFIATIAALGGNPTPLPFGEVYSAMQTHLIEGAENNWRTFHTSRHFEVAHYWSQSDHSYSPEALLLSRRTYDALSTRDREVVVEAARASVPYMRALWDKMEAESQAFVLAAGVKANDVDLPAFRKVAASIQERYLADRSLRQIFDGIRGLA
ncbi:MAG TPA: TRAP transporter substrate-binding protein [Casimicrobiaceae bacterium]|nr:TRAP transporter substrate-binding protein [Casimicrobiaceae bacterium]